MFLLTSFKFSDDWKKTYNKGGLLIYTRTTESGLKEFKAISTLDAKVGEITAVFKDWKTHTDWMPAMIKTELVEQANTKTRYLYYVLDFPWPLWDRDLVTKSNFTKGEDGSIKMSVLSSSSKKTKDKNMVRITEATGYWKFIPQKNETTKVIYQYKADPVGIPTRIVNAFLLEGPKGSFEGLKKQMKLPKYKNATLDWLD
jgi:hypothetical protein